MGARNAAVTEMWIFGSRGPRALAVTTPSQQRSALAKIQGGPVAIVHLPCFLHDYDNSVFTSAC
jgi:hypothetical protein